MSVSRQFIPVNPLLDDDGAFVSLKDYTSASMKPNPFEGADPVNTQRKGPALHMPALHE